MTQLSFHNSNSLTKPPPTGILPVVEKLKSSYLLWVQYHQTIPKTHRYSLGQRIDKTLVEAIEGAITAGFLSRQEKLPFVRMAMRKVDTAKILLMVLWEAKSLDNKKYIALSEKLGEAGRMLGGWSGQLIKQNSPSPVLRKTGEGEK